MHKVITAIVLATLLGFAGCAGTGSSRPADTGPSFQQRLKQKVNARAEYESYLHRYQRIQQQHRLQEWRRIRAEAERRIAERERRKEARLEAARRRWLWFQ